VAPRTFFRYFLAKVEVVWSEYQPMLAGYVADRPDDELAMEALRHRSRHDSAGRIRPPGRQGLASALKGTACKRLIQALVSRT